MRASLCFVIAAAGCGTTRAAEPVGNRAAPPPKPACTDAVETALAQHLQARWNTASVSIVHCTPGLFPMPGFFVEVDDGTQHRVGIVDKARADVVPFEIADAPAPATSIIACASVDLDGDGTDEIVETWRTSARGMMRSDSWLEIRRIADGAFLPSIRGPHTSIYHPELGGCAAELRLAGKTIVITVEVTIGIPPSNCLAAGTHSFALEKNAIVQI